LWSRLDLGTDESPQSSATLFVEVDALSDQPLHDGLALTLRGAGIATVRQLAVAGLSEAFWRWRSALQSELPRGIDIVLVCGARLAALPRSTRITVDS
jgi:alpha-D-ribose 1-methylphosphonate 5-triphosphate synthase subunit PhnH